MDASPVQIIEYFDGKKQNLIPLFQRPYAWEKKDWQALWDDIMVQYDSEGRSRHFMGAIVSMPARAWPAGGVNKYLIIDGQQRLTTLAIILCAIRDTSDERTAEMIQDSLVNRHNDGADKLKLFPTQLDREAFRTLVIDKKPFDGSSRINDAYGFYISAIRGKDPNGQLVNPQKLYGILEQSLQVVMINLGETDNPYLIFESLNHKGEPLSQADLVRNYVLMCFRHSMSAGGDQERVYERLWKPMEEMLGQSLADFFRHYLIKDGEDVKKNNVYSSMKARFALLPKPEEVERELQKVSKFASYYMYFIKPEKEPDLSVQAHLDAIKNIEITTCYPLLLRLYDSYKEGRIDRDTFIHCLEMTESFLVRRMICNVITSPLNKLYLTWSKNYTDVDTAEWLSANLRHGEATSRWPGDDELEAAILTQPIYERDLTKYLLWRIEGSYGHKEQVIPETLTIEHVLPQKMSKEWETSLGQDSQNIHKTFVDTLGNLTLTGYNSELGNLAFEKKKEKLANTHVEMNKIILDKEKWTDAEILERGEELTRRIIILWPGPEA